MLASLNFVEKFISLPKISKKLSVSEKTLERNAFDVEKIVPILTRQGFEVEKIVMRGEGFDSVVVGRIEKVEPHPSSQKLQICYVNVAEGSLRQIVCGAPNARKDLYVAVALPGTKLPNGLEIKPARIRDIESCGMLCSREELGLFYNKEIDGEGIWEIDQDFQGGRPPHELANLLGVPLYDALQMSDVLLDLSVTPNRPDMLSQEGVARELAAGFAYAHIPFVKKDPSLTHKVTIKETKIKSDVIHNSIGKCGNISFSVKNDLDLPAFFMLIDSVEVKPSPAWLRNTLEALGQNSISNIVDVSNYILLAYGQPNHAFDLEKIAADKLTIRNARVNEKFAGLDGKERALHEHDHVVADGNGVQALLGVLGGDQTKVAETTKKIVVEFANPNSVTVRKTSRRHGCQTDASFLFEKGIEASARYKAAAEFFALVSECLNTKPEYCGSIHSADEKNRPVIKTEFSNLTVDYSNKEQKRILGTDLIPYDKQLEILSSLGFHVNRNSENSAHVTVPGWRSYDIAGPADLVEEFIRVVGIDAVPSAPVLSETIVNKDDTHYSFIEKLCAKSAALGYTEVLSLHFMRADDHEKLGLPSINSLGEPIALLNPIIGDEPLLHTTLIPDLLRKVSTNLAYGTKSGQLFHSCRTFQNADMNAERVFHANGEAVGLQVKLEPKIDDIFEYHPVQGYQYSYEPSQSRRPVETPRLAGVLFGNKTEKTWQNQSSVPWSLYDVMAHVEELCRTVGVTLEINKVTNHPISPALHPGRQVAFKVSSGYPFPSMSLGFAGELHPRTMRAYKIDVPTYIFEINLAVLMRIATHIHQKVKSIVSDEQFPTVSRDYSFLISENITAKELNETVKTSVQDLFAEAIPARLHSVKVFDIYRGKGVAEGKKSVAFNIMIEPFSRTLTEKDIQKISQNIIEAITKNLSGELRE